MARAAPEGRDETAQGEALGFGSNNGFRALQGRHGSILNIALVARDTVFVQQAAEFLREG